jgi:PAS domain-containing protein
MTPYTLALELTLMLATWLAIGAWQRERGIPGRVTYGAAALAVVAWLAGELIEMRGEMPLLARRIRTVGVLTLPPLWFGVAAHAVKLPLIRRTPWIPLILMVPMVPLYALLYAGPWSVLFIPATDAIQVDVGPLMWWYIAYAWTLVVVGVAVLLQGAWRADSVELRRERLKMALSVIAPLLANGLAVWNLSQSGRTGLDVTPLMIAVTLIAFRRSILSGGLLDVLPVAQRDIIQHLPFGVVLADGHGAVIDMNPAAEELLEVSRVEALGRALDAVISRAPLEVRIEISTVQGRGGESARFALLEAPKAPAPRVEPAAEAAPAS